MKLRINMELIVGVVAVILGLIAGAILMVLTGNDPLEGYQYLFAGGLMNIERVGNTSMKIRIEVWETADPCRPIVKLTEGVYTYVAIDEDGKPRSVPAEACPT